MFFRGEKALFAVFQPKKSPKDLLLSAPRPPSLTGENHRRVPSGRKNTAKSQNFLQKRWRNPLQFLDLSAIILNWHILAMHKGCIAKRPRGGENDE
jgi:hypothetical protein